MLTQHPSRMFVAALELLERRQLLSIALPMFAQANLVSDQPGIAVHTDLNLVNAWGIVETPAGAVWVANNGSGTSTVYDSAGNGAPAGAPLVVTIPGPAGVAVAAPTGVALNQGRNFAVSSTGGTGPSQFLYATENGALAGWAPALHSTTAVLAVDNSAAGAVYKGLALAGSGRRQELFAANFGQERVDVFNGKFAPLTLPAGAFVDSSIPAGFAPFNIENVGGKLFVTYAMQDALHQNDVPGPGLGFIDVFNAKGKLIRRFAAGGALDAPWGLTPIRGPFRGRYPGRQLRGRRRQRLQLPWPVPRRGTGD